MTQERAIYDHPAISGKSPQDFPKHILIIPDGNNTFATKEGISRLEGHMKGMDKSIEISRSLREIEEIKAVSFWVLSTKNLDNRTKEETMAIMDMVARGLRDPQIVKDFMDSEVRLIHLGSEERFSPDLKESLSELEDKTNLNKKHTLSLLIDYGWDYELEQIAKSAREFPHKESAELPSYRHLPPVDLIIRSKGLHQVSDIGPIIGEAVLDFIDKTWPEVTMDNVLDSIAKFTRYQRNFGGRK